jgi:predicted kinase
MAMLHLVVGPVGAGKSTFALELCRQHNALRLNLDEWMVDLFRADRLPESARAPEDALRRDNLEWYIERTARCIELIWKIAERTIDLGTQVVLEIGLIQRGERERFYERVDSNGYALTVYVLDAPRDLRRARVLSRNQQQGPTFSMEVPPHIFELASDMWEPPDEAECSERTVRFVP